MLITAHKIHDGKHWLPEGSIIDYDAEGRIQAILDAGTAKADIVHDGILCPGMINAHCHVELSHLKGAIPMHTGLPGFLKSVMGKRNDFNTGEIQVAMIAAVKAMQANGIVGLGDIANTEDSLPLREQSGLYWHTFVESMGFVPATANKRFEASKTVWESFKNQATDNPKQWRQSIVPHAPYSVSAALFQLIDTFENNRLLSIHNQETEAENTYYHNKTGVIANFLQDIGIDDSSFSPSGKSAVQSYLEYLSPQHPILLVHNTFSSREDVEWVENQFPHTYWCLCPNANLYIENRLPDIPMLANTARHICIGTDSLASNHELSILSELHSIYKAYPELGWETLLRWATWNGALALQMDTELGSISVGKRPGLIGLSSDCSHIISLF